MTHVAVPDKLARAGDIRCATRDPRTGAIWMGAKSGALVFRPDTREWRHVRLKDESIEACGPGVDGVWLASRECLMQPESHGAGVRRFRIADATGSGARVTGVAVDSGGTWLSVSGLDGPVPSLLRLPRRPPVFLRLQVKLGVVAGWAQAITGNGERAWVLGPTWMTELTAENVAKPGAWPEGQRPDSRRPVVQPGATTEELLTTYVMQLSPACWLRVHARGLVGRNEQGVFCTAFGTPGSTSPQLPGHLDLFATDWMAHAGVMLMPTPLGLFITDAQGLAVIAPGEHVVALLEGPTPSCVTRTGIHAVTAAALASAPRVRVDLPMIARELARRNVVAEAPCQRATAASVLRLVGEPRDTGLLVTLLADGSPEVRALACDAVGHLKPEGYEQLLATMMADPATNVQAVASRWLRGG